MDRYCSNLSSIMLIAIKQPIGSTKGWIFNSLGKTDVQLKWGIVSSIAAIIAFVIGVQWGIMGVAIAYVIRGYVLHYHGIVIPGRLINMSFIEFHKNVAGVFVLSVLTGIAVWGIGFLMPTHWSYISRLAVQIPSGVLIFWTLVHIFSVQAYKESIEILKEKWNSLIKTRKTKEL